MEKAHVEALDKWVAKESMHEAVGVWEDILSRHPRDELAVKFAHDAYFFLVPSALRAWLGRIVRMMSHRTASFPHDRGRPRR